jgi:hypothetical protein
MGGACGADGGGQRRFGGGNLRERGHYGNPSVDERIILRWTFRKWYVGHGLDRAGSG